MPERIDRPALVTRERLPPHQLQQGLGITRDLREIDRAAERLDRPALVTRERPQH